MTVYEVHVATGELWNAGTVANVYIAVYGEKGDTGSRQLFRSKSTLNFLRGQVSNKKSFVLLSLNTNWQNSRYHYINSILCPKGFVYVT